MAALMLVSMCIVKCDITFPGICILLFVMERHHRGNAGRISRVQRTRASRFAAVIKVASPRVYEDTSNIPISPLRTSPCVMRSKMDVIG